MRITVPFLLLLAFTACSDAPKATPAAEAPKPAVVPDIYRVQLETTKGDIVLEVRKEWAPRAAERFHELVEAGYYDGTKFHRVLRGFVAQFGIHPNPKTGALWRELKFADEPVKLSNKRGTLAFAHSGPHTRAVQVFLNLRDNSAALDKQGFPAFAKIVEGMEIADKISFLYGETGTEGRGPRRHQSRTAGQSVSGTRLPAPGRHSQSDRPQREPVVVSSEAARVW
jgi:cyclophilin family peptidyl-prolyl cis-trans isomerase